jgi:molybdopterin-guanine dinucleotide biosynthesis protein A
MTGRSAVVLAGGRSRRFGQDDKALAELGGEPLVARVVDRVSTVADEVIVSCRPAQVEPFERVLPSAVVDGYVEDRFSDVGPLAGIGAGLDATSGEYVAVVACDMPLVEPSVLETLFDRAAGVDAAVPKQEDGHLQPVQAVYRAKPMQDAVDRALPDGGNIRSVLDALEVVTVSAAGFPERSFYNVNTREDLADAERRWIEDG